MVEQGKDHRLLNKIKQYIDKIYINIYICSVKKYINNISDGTLKLIVIVCGVCLTLDISAVP